MWRTLGAISVALSLTGCASGDAATADQITCAELADEAVTISEDQDVQLIKVRAPKVELDKQETGWEKPTGTEETVILRCLGRGVWSDGSDNNVRLEATVDADGDAFVSYQATH